MHTQTDSYTPSAQQRTFWKVQQTHIGDLAVSGILEIANSVTDSSLESAIAHLVGRHEALRTTLAESPELGLAQIISSADAASAIVRVSTAASLFTLEAADALPAHPLEGPLQTSIVSGANGKRWLWLRAGGAVCDLKSLTLLAGELNQLLRGQELTSEALQHADYAAWQDESRASHEAASAQQALKGLRGDEAATATLPWETPASPDKFSGGRLEQALPAWLQKASPSKILALWAGYLCRITGQSEVQVAVSLGARATELQTAVGPYAQFVPVNFNLNEEATFGSLEKAAAEKCDILCKSEAFFDSSDSAAPAQTSLPFLFEFVSTNAPDDRVSLRDIRGAAIPCRVILRVVQGSISKLEVVYDAVKLRREAAIRMLNGFLAFAEAGTDQTLVATASLIGPDELNRLIRDFQGPRASMPEASGIEQLFEQAAIASPNQTAVICGAERVTYKELNERANQLAHHLRRLGAGPETLVGLSTKRSIEMVIGIVGIIKSGAAYVPLDPGYPANRLTSMIEDAHLALVVTTPGVTLPANNARTILLEQRMLGAETTSNPPQIGSAERLAYVIFTSGSTGKPKGAMISHRGLLNSTFARAHYYPGRVENYLLVSSFSFDSSVAGIFWTLTQGGTLTIPEEGMHQDPDELARLISAERVSHFLSLPSLYNALLDRLKDHSSLRVVVVAGEACPVELVRRHAQQIPNAGLYNEYGPTEATVWSTVFKCDPASVERTVPIGKAIPNWQTFVVDSHLNLCPIGVSGELLVGGPGLSRGYLNRPELTESKFIDNRFTPEYSAKLYRTGDLVRLLKDGNIEFLGRIDHQVKIRGFRIELEEIEAILRAQPGVHDALVMARDEGPAGKELVGYVVRNGIPLDPAALKNAIASQLPEHMVPNALVVLDKFPLNPNGKVDRNALPAPQRTSSQPSNEAMTPSQTAVAKIFGDLLKLRHVALDDSFFALGGHSLLAMQLISRVRDQFQAEVSLRNLFENPTVRGLSQAVDAGSKAGKGGGIKRARRENVRSLLGEVDEMRP